MYNAYTKKRDEIVVVASDAFPSTRLLQASSPSWPGQSEKENSTKHSVGMLFLVSL
jgi:hypothetical protein